MQLFEFVATLEEVSFNLTTAAIFIPHSISISIPRGNQKVIGLMNGVPFSIGLQFRKDAGRYLSVSSPLRRAAKISPGDSVEVTFRLINVNKVEVPETLNKLAVKLPKGKSTNDKTSLTIENYLDAAARIDIRIRNAIKRIRKAKAVKDTDKKRPHSWRRHKK